MKNEKVYSTGMSVVLALLFLVLPLHAQEAGGGSTGDLAKKSQNPVADMISLPLQYNTYLNTGPEGNRTQDVLLIQPVMPLNLNDAWNFIARPIIPVLNQPPFTEAQEREYGFGNLQFQGFFSPKEEVGGWILGVGPYFEFPTNSSPDNRFGSDNFSAGPALVALQMKGPWVYGGLVTQLWSYAGNDPEVNQTAMQPFVNYNMKDGCNRSRDIPKKNFCRRDFGLARSWVSRYILAYGRQGCHDIAIGPADRSAPLSRRLLGADQ